MTTLKSKFEYCYPEKTFALSFNCTGAYCSYLTSYPDTTCTNITTGVLQCSNGITCSQPSNYTSEQTVSNTGGSRFSRNESIVLSDFCTVHTFISDGTSKGREFGTSSIANCKPKAWAIPGSSSTTATVTLGSGATTTIAPGHAATTSAKPSVGSGIRPHSLHFSMSSFIICLFLFMDLFIGGALALSPKLVQHDLAYLPTSDLIVPRMPAHEHMLTPRAGFFTMDEYVDLLGEYYGSVFNKLNHGKPVAAEGIICEVLGFACDHGAFLLVDAATAGGATAFIEGCAMLIVDLAAVEPPMELLAILGAKTFCNWFFNEVFGPSLEDFTKQICSPVEEVCKKRIGEGKAKAIFHPAVELVDLSGDVNNCGEVGKQCPSGSTCKAGACTSAICKAASGTQTTCGDKTGCICAKDESDTGYCVQDATSCGNVVGWAPDKCTSTENDCPLGYICTTSPLCGNKVCLNAATCLGTGFDSDSSSSAISSVAAAAPSSITKAVPTSKTSTTSTLKAISTTTTKLTTTTPASTAFPPSVIPASGQLSGWHFYLKDSTGYTRSDSDFFSASFMSYNGIKTVNTVCLAFKADTDDELLPSPSIPAGVGFRFESRETPNTDSCCVALFSGSSCDVATEKVQKVCEGSAGGSDGTTAFVVEAWQVYGCKGRM